MAEVGLLLIDFVSCVLLPAGLLTAVLYYFGHVREQALFTYFGDRSRYRRLSTTDYLVRSAGTVFLPLATVLVGGVVAVVAHHVLVYLLPQLGRRWQRGVWMTLGATALVLLVAGVVGLQQRVNPPSAPSWPRWHWPAEPCSLSTPWRSHGATSQCRSSCQRS